MIPSILFILFALSGVAASVAAAVRRSHRWCFLAAFLFWIVSFLAVWSIGWILLVLPFICLAVGMGRWLGWVRRPWQVLAAAVMGAGLWAVAIRWFWGAWLYWPWAKLLELLDS